MNELLILVILLGGGHTIYKIRQKIKSGYTVFLGASFGAIHPALKKLEKNGFVATRRKFSAGGQKSCVYTITKAGRAYFQELMTADASECGIYSNIIASLKMMHFDLAEKNLQNKVLDSVERYYLLQKLNIEEIIQNLGENLQQLEQENNKKKTNSSIKIRFLKQQSENMDSTIKEIKKIKQSIL